MSSNKILASVIAATVLNVATASTPVLTLEKQKHAAVMNELLDGITVVMGRPECTIKTVVGSSE